MNEDTEKFNGQIITKIVRLMSMRKELKPGCTQVIRDI
jgi:hypothetical protein